MLRLAAQHLRRSAAGSVVRDAGGGRVWGGAEGRGGAAQREPSWPGSASARWKLLLATALTTPPSLLFTAASQRCVPARPRRELQVREGEKGRQEGKEGASLRARCHGPRCGRKKTAAWSCPPALSAWGTLPPAHTRPPDRRLLILSLSLSHFPFLFTAPPPSAPRATRSSASTWGRPTRASR